MYCHALNPRTSADGEHLEWFDTDRAYAGKLDAPEWLPAGSTMGRTPVCPERSRTYHRMLPLNFENNPLIYGCPI